MGFPRLVVAGMLVDWKRSSTSGMHLPSLGEAPSRHPTSYLAASTLTYSSVECFRRRTSKILLFLGARPGDLKEETAVLIPWPSRASWVARARGAST